MMIRSRTRDDVLIVDLQGKVVGEESLQLKRSLEALVENSGEGPVFVVVNLKGVPFLDSAGLGAIVFARECLSQRGGELGLLAPTPHVRRLLTVARLNETIPIYDDEETAVAAIPKTKP